MYQIVLCTCPNDATADKIAEVLVEEKLAACVNIVSGVRSVYRWQGAIEKDIEVQLIIKSKTSFFSSLSDKIIQLHPYDVPEIIAIDITQSSPSYMNWLEEALTHE